MPSLKALIRFAHLAFTCLIPIAEANGAKPLHIRDYQAHIACGNEVTVWLGHRVAVVLDGEKPEQRDPAIMAKITSALDGIFNAYDKVTGKKPKLTADIKKRIIVEVSDKVGGGLANHGQYGIGIGDGFFNDLYERVKVGTNTYDQVFFYEAARNYWMPDMNPAIDYHTTEGPTDYGWWTVGFNNAMSVVMPRQVQGVTDMVYFGQSGQQFSDSMEANLTEYLSKPEKYNWENSWCVRLVPWKENTSLNDLMTGLLIRLQRENGGIDFMTRLYSEIPKQRPLPTSLSDYQSARDNFYAAASIAAKEDLFVFFTKDLRWQISDKAHQKVKGKL
ncbi:MAG: hypothetical protein ABL974_20810 [Prosthecobacter sp.]